MKKMMALCLSTLLLAGCSAQQQAPETTVETTIALETTAEPTTETTAAPETTDVSQPETAPAAQTPIHADRIKDGTYEISVESSSSMFKIVKCVLVVEDGKMNATMTMSGQGYGKLYMGTGEEALAASEDSYIPFETNDEDMKEFTVPVEALDMEINCAAWSIKKESWYDRVLVFQSSQLPADAVKAN